MTDKMARQLANAIQLWLDYQILCRREMLLSEAYLAQPIGEFLRSHHVGKIKAEWNHPNIPSARGRPRQLDYVLFSRDKDRPVTAIEAKWITDTPTDKQRLLDDILRLECIRNKDHQAMMRYFLVAGETNNVQKHCLDLSVNSNGLRQNFINIVLPLAEAPKRMDVKQCPDALRSFFKSFDDNYKVRLPNSYKTQMVSDQQGVAVRVVVWKVTSSQKRSTFSADCWGDVIVPSSEDGND